MTDPAPFHYQPLSEPGQIRLVTILPGDQGAYLQLQLEHIDLTSNAKYECLSYAWGQVGHDQPLTLNNSSFLISSTLHTALQHLRHPQRSRKIWIDAISINQADVEERSQQVAIMRTIYKSAKRVIVWLGPATESSEKAMAFLKMMGAANTRYRSPRREERRTLSSSTDLFSKAIHLGLRLILYILEFVLSPIDRYILRRTYHKALATQRATKNDFTVTSLTSSSTTYPHQREFFTNKYTSHWAALDALLAHPWFTRTWIVQEVWSASTVLLQCGTTTLPWPLFQRAMDYTEAWDHMGDLVRGTAREKDWDALRRRYTLAIHLAKERVNGRALSTLLVTTWDRKCTDPRDKVFAMLALIGDGAMRPDYTKSMGQVYQETARDIIVTQGKMDILLAASGVDGDEGLPSWVPDWRCEAFGKKPTLLVNRRLMLKLLYGGSMRSAVLVGHGYRAAGGSKPFARFSEDLNVLTVKSQKIDEVAEICEVDVGGLRDEEFIDQVYDFVRRSEYVHASTRQQEAERRTQSDKAKENSVVFATLTGGGKIRNDKWAGIIRNVMQRRRLFVTQDGHLGIGPVTIQPGDVVVIISGCNFPIVLRPREEKFAVLGEAYSMCSSDVCNCWDQS